jgi:hypothetical protein
MRGTGQAACTIRILETEKILVKKLKDILVERPIYGWKNNINPLNAELNPIRHLLVLVGAGHIVHVSRIRVKRDLQRVEGCVQ